VFVFWNRGSFFATIAVSRAADRTRKPEEERNKGLLGLSRSKE
jgi:hypothetical protein